MNLFIGTDPDTGRQYLVTVYDDSSSTIAIRPNEWATWSPPVELVAQPVDGPTS